MCEKRPIFKLMQQEDKEDLKTRCGGNWKIVLRFLVQGERCYRREKSQADAGPGHSVVVTSSGKVYTFGNNSSGQLGTGSFESESRPYLLRCESFREEPILLCYIMFYWGLNHVPLRALALLD